MTVTSVTMTINAIQNKRTGPGGRTRQLHHDFAKEIKSTDFISPEHASCKIQEYFTEAFRIWG